MHSVLGNHKTMTHQYTVNVIHVYRELKSLHNTSSLVLKVYEKTIKNVHWALYSCRGFFWRDDLRALCLPYSGKVWSDIFTSVGDDRVSAFGCSGTLSADVDCSLMTILGSVSSATP